MWIERLEVGGFGRLRGSFELEPGITLVTGANECGKTTLHQALLRSLFGFEWSERRRSGGSSQLQRWCPWEGPPFGLDAVIHRDGGRALRASWRFDHEASDHELRLIDEHTGEELRGEVSEHRGDILLGRYLLELDYPEFCQVCMLEQAAIGAVERSDPLVTSLRRAAEMGASEVGVDRATELLDAALRSPEIGARRDNLAPLTHGALADAEERLAEVRADLDRAGDARRQAEELWGQLDGLRSRERGLEAEHAAAEQELLMARVESLAERAANAERAHQEANDVPDQAAPLDTETEEQAGGALTELDRLERERAEIASRAEAVAEQVRELEGEVARLEPSIRALSAFESIDDSAFEEAHALLARIEEHRAQPEPAPEPSASGTGAVALAGLIAAASLAAGIFATPLAFLGLLGAAVVAYVGWSSGHARPAPGTLQYAPERLAELEADLARLLDGADAPADDDLRARATSYLEACRRHREGSGLRSRHAALRAEISEASQPARRLQEIDEAIEGAAALAREALAAAGVGDPDLDAARRELDELASEAAQIRQREERARQAGEVLRTALGGVSLEELRSRLEASERRLREHRARHGELVQAPRDEQESEGEVGRLAFELSGVRGDAARIEGQLEQHEGELARVPALREERFRLEDRIERIREAAEAVRIARNALGEAASRAHRRFAPALNEAIARDLPAITAGRYRQARVDEDLALTLDAPETGDPVSAEVLSRGTQDQIYLVERLAILGMLDTGDETPPLLLDDVFVHFDSHRLAFALELIEREAERRQVVLFADDPRIVEGLDGRRVIELDAV